MLLQLQEAENWKKPAATTWAAEFLLREGDGRECLGVLFTVWVPVADPGRTPLPGNNSGRTRAIEPRYRPPGQQWILVGGLRGGGSE